ncbi:vWA domain-containing protein [Teredinibacter purpureus]|uniref:vWA domain-containing protein n=1 Tax=Teredinibacter purpureus TaxID=2731756 RepID=UPI0005F86991|nr:VWA domain-containing protein [Teredinibacter purpureus]
MFEFSWPWVFFVLPLPLAVYLFVPSVKRQAAALKVPFFSRVRTLYKHSSHSVRGGTIITALPLLVCWLLLVCAGARPQWIGDAVTLPTSGRDLLLAVDISGSMETPDMVVEDQQIPRISVVKYVVTDFIDRRESDRIGLVLFGSQAYLQSPLTFDRPTVSQLLDEAQLGFAGEQTAIGDAIGLAIKRLKERPDSHRVLVLLTDGANTSGEVMPRQAADLAKQAGVKIYTIGVGANKMVQRMGIFGGMSRTVNPSSELDEDTLKYIADTTGGTYFRAHDPQELQQIYYLLDQLEPIEQAGETLRPIRALYYWPLAIALVLSMLVAVFRLIKIGTVARVTLSGEAKT